MRRSSHVVVAAAITVTSVAAGSSHSARAAVEGSASTPTYSVTDLGPEDETYNWNHEGNSVGPVTVTSAASVLYPFAGLETRSKTISRPENDPAGNGYGTFYMEDVNDSNVVVGHILTSASENTAAVWNGSADGDVETLDFTDVLTDLPGGASITSSDATGIDDAGEIVGWVDYQYGSSGSPKLGSAAFTTSSPSADPILATDPDNSSNMLKALALNGPWELASGSSGGDFLFNRTTKARTTASLGTPTIHLLSGDGSYLSPSPPQSITTAAGVTTALQVPASDFAVPASISNGDVVAGPLIANDYSQRAAAIWDATGTMTNLGTVTGLPLTDAQIGRSGQIVAETGATTPEVYLLSPQTVPPVVNSTGDAAALSGGAQGCTTGQTVMVNSSPQPECTLRAAIQAENSGAASSGTITFDLPANANDVIQPGSALPPITEAGVTLDGTTAPGALVTLNGYDVADTAAGIEVQAAAVTVEGLFVENCLGEAVLLDSPAGHDVVEGNDLGVEPSGGAESNHVDIEIRNSPDNVVGGTTAAAGNVISAALLGVQIDGASANANSVEGNLIGTNTDGTAAVGDGIGVLVRDGSHNRIGGPAATRGTSPGNVIVAASGGSITSSANTNAGVFVGGVGSAATGNVIQGNLIGLNKAATATLSAPGLGVEVAGRAIDTQVGGAGNAGNVIAGASVNDIYLAGTSVSGTVLAGNLIGTTPDASTELHADGTGIEVGAASTTTIGLAGEANQISGSPKGIVVTHASPLISFQFGDKATLPGTGTSTDKALSTSISYNDIGTLDDGKKFSPDAVTTGVLLNGNNDEVRHNVISGCLIGVSVTEPTGRETIEGNKIGVDNTGLRNLPDAIGVLAKTVKKELVIGGDAQPNIVGSQDVLGIDVADAPKVRVTGNRVGVTPSGSSAPAKYKGAEPQALADYLHSDVHIGVTIDGSDQAALSSNVVGHMTDGIEVKRSSDVQLGAKLAGAKHDAVSGEGNHIFDNTADGVELDHAAADSTLSNRIYHNGKGGIFDGDGFKAPQFFANNDDGHTELTGLSVAKGGVVQVYRASSCGAHPQFETLLHTAAAGHHINIHIEPVGTDLVILYTRNNIGSSLPGQCTPVQPKNKT